MRLTIWGCRGSVPTPGPGSVEYGGNTSCLEVCLDDGEVFVLDAGTGIRELGYELSERGTRRVHLLLTHLHLDHLEGLRFFAPLWDERVSVDIWGPPSPVLSLKERLLRSVHALHGIQEHGKLVAAYSREGVALPHTPADPLRHFA